jgi:DNA-binding transcriptional LysR family regulator
MLIDLVQLKTFVVVAEEEHLTRAAERLFISQSAASAHVRAVEDRLGTQLFVRTNRSLELTQAGQLVAKKARELLNEEALFKSFVRELRGQIEGRLVLGTSSAPGTRVGEILANFRTKHPLVNVDIMARPSSSARRGLASGELDVGILLCVPLDPAFTYHKLTTVQYRVAGPAAWRDRIVAAGWMELAAFPWLTPTTSSAYSAMIAQMFADKGLTINSVMCFDNSAIGFSALKAGAGLMIVREDEALQGENDGFLAISPIARAQADLSVAYQTARKNDPLIKAFIEAAASVWPLTEAEGVDIAVNELPHTQISS